MNLYQSFSIKPSVVSYAQCYFTIKKIESEGLSTTESIDVDCTGVGSSKQCDICHFYFFKNRNFNYQHYICDGCHDAALRAQAITDIKIIIIKRGTYRVISNISHEDSTRLLKSNDLDEKLGYL